jgi:hypothetical protein
MCLATRSPGVRSDGAGVRVAGWDRVQELRLRRSGECSLRRILPAADLGIAAMNSTCRTFLYGATCAATNSITSSALSAASAVTTNAFGISSPSASVTPITAASAMAGWVSSRASSSAGGTW